MKEETVSYNPVTDRTRIAQGILSMQDITVCTKIAIANTQDIVDARQKGRIITLDLGCSSTQATLVATAISELARNIILYAGRGELTLSRIENGARVGLQIVAADDGPGIPNIARALTNGFSTSGGLGLGLPGLTHIADIFRIESQPGQGVRVEMVMWLTDR